MSKRSLLLVFTLFALNAYAEIYSCKKPSGETEFSDTPCKAGNASAVVPDRDHLTPQREAEAQEKLAQQKKQVNESAAQRATSESPTESPEVVPSAAPAEDVYVGGTCNDLSRGPRSNCADDLYKKQLPPVLPRPRPVPRPVSR